MGKPAGKLDALHSNDAPKGHRLLILQLDPRPDDDDGVVHFRVSAKSFPVLLLFWFYEHKRNEDADREAKDENRSQQRDVDIKNESARRRVHCLSNSRVERDER